VAQLIMLTGEQALALAQIVQVPHVNPQTGMPMPLAYEQLERIEEIIQQINHGLGDYFTETEAIENDFAERRTKETDKYKRQLLDAEQAEALEPLHQKYKTEKFEIVLEGREYEYAHTRVKSGGGLPAGADTHTRRTILAIGKAMDLSVKVSDESTPGDVRPFVPRPAARRQRQQARREAKTS
jgi:hypothetical protein